MLPLLVLDSSNAVGIGRAGDSNLYVPEVNIDRARAGPVATTD